MPLQNRVHASGRLEAVAARGTLMGNRGGRIHHPETRSLKRGQPWASRRWICCVLAFRGRHRTVWGDGYTELFFLDEVTALAAGHRPCFECRRADAMRFQTALLDGFGAAAGWGTKPSADAMDRCLHAARTGQREQTINPTDLPIGTTIARDGAFLAVAEDGVLPWSHDGYETPLPFDATKPWTVVTPAPIVAALRAGYRPLWHGSAPDSLAGQT